MDPLLVVSYEGGGGEKPTQETVTVRAASRQADVLLLMWLVGCVGLMLVAVLIVWKQSPCSREQRRAAEGSKPLSVGRVHGDVP